MVGSVGGRPLFFHKHHPSNCVSARNSYSGGGAALLIDGRRVGSVPVGDSIRWRGRTAGRERIGIEVGGRWEDARATAIGGGDRFDAPDPPTTA